MASDTSISTLRAGWMPLAAIFRHDLRTLLASRLLRFWVAAAAVLTLVWTASAWQQLPSARLIASLMFPWLVFPWFVVVMALGVYPVSGSRADSLAHGFLSRPITRYEYLLGIWTARLAVVIGSFLLILVPAIAVVALANRPAQAEHLTVYGVVAALAVVSLVLALQVSLALLFGVLLQKLLPAVVALLFLWGPVNILLDGLKLEAFSPITLNRALPVLLQQPWRAGQAAALSPVEPEEAVRQLGSTLGAFFGSAPPEPPPRPRGFFERDEYHRFSLGTVLLGYGIPTLAAIGLAIACFCRRDL
jgi:ABC-type transport system involved in multi-copper enzyme maturation permease subunit